MLTWVEGVMNRLGYAGVVFLMFIENVFPPIPSEVVMPLAGYTAARGELGFAGVVIAGMLGSVLGALPLYYLGYTLGEERLAQWADKRGKWLALSGDDVRKAGKWFSKYQGVAVFLARLVPGVRSLISIPAGVAKMNMMIFLLYTATGTGIWAFILALLGRALGNNYEQVSVYLEPLSRVVIGILLAWTIGWVLKRKFGWRLPFGFKSESNESSTSS
jgi:membrane protein DedA with SNARE-associated domain